jgi:hypothetical protein
MCFKKKKGREKKKKKQNTIKTKLQLSHKAPFLSKDLVLIQGKIVDISLQRRLVNAGAILAIGSCMKQADALDLALLVTLAIKRFGTLGINTRAASDAMMNNQDSM